jgi:hypothetical protein
VKFLKWEEKKLIFQMSKDEKDLLLDLLKLYPAIPPGHHRLSTRDNPDTLRANQQLLDEALAEHRADNKRQLETMLQAPNRFRPVPPGYWLVLTDAELEWLLQVLNDVRVGSWVRLGSPDVNKGRNIQLDLPTARHFWIMELCGHFQHVLINSPRSS